MRVIEAFKHSAGHQWFDLPIRVGIFVPASADVDGLQLHVLSLVFVLPVASHRRRIAKVTVWKFSTRNVQLEGTMKGANSHFFTLSQTYREPGKCGVHVLSA